MMAETDIKKINDLLGRGVEQILPDRDGLAKLMSQRKIRLYLGIDPTAKRLHLGHTINLRKLQKFAELGHEAILVVGTGTVLAGDPSLRESARPKISKEEIQANIKEWKSQLPKILDFSKIKIKHNGDWLSRLCYEEIINIESNISIVKLLQRDMFEARLKKGDTVWTHEALYPLFQGYDSVALDIDLEIGGTDQTFNMLIGRELMQKMKKKEKFIMANKMILGTDGQPMSKTKGNCIWLTDSAQEMYGKVMSISDQSIFTYAESLTDLPLEEVKKIAPREAKARLAEEIVKIYHGEKAAVSAEKEFNKIFQEGGMPSEIPEVSIKEKSLNILDLLVRAKLASSKSEAKRLVGQGGVEIDGEVKKDWRESVSIKQGQIIQVGKRKFAKII